MEAQISGLQRKVVQHQVKPVSAAHGGSGIPLKDGTALPFKVTRSWSAPAGVYVEQMFLIDPKTREVLYEGRARETAIWGLQGTTEMIDEIDSNLSLQPGTYALVFALDSVEGGRFEVDAHEVSTQAA